MDIGIIVFAYNRSWHLKKVLDGLRENKGVSKLYVFQDGLKCDEHRNEWIKTQQIIKDIDWCKVIYKLSSYNKGLANAIVDGINIVLEENDAFVVLEDDCVPHPLFIEYVTKCLEKYQYEKRVFSINGYSWNSDVAPNGTDAYFIGRTSSWGWATWKDRWQLYKQDYKLIVKIRKDLNGSHQLDVWGQDLENYLLGNVCGRCDSWAVFWSLKCLEMGGFCPTPYFSLIDNIGFDGTGVHCGNADMLTQIRDWEDREEVELPSIIEFPENYESAFKNWFKWTAPEVRLNCYNNILLQWNLLLQMGISVLEYFDKNNIKSIAIWGKGNLCNVLLNEIRNRIEISFIIESRPSCKQYGGIPVVSPDSITKEVQTIVVIPVYDMVNIQKRVEEGSSVKLIGIDEILECLKEEDKRRERR